VKGLEEKGKKKEGSVGRIKVRWNEDQMEKIGSSKQQLVKRKRKGTNGQGERDRTS